ncbi:MAG: response regulator [Pseudomonadota bacterium]
MKSIINKTASIVVVHPTQIIRQLIKSSLKSLGFEKCHLFADYATCLSHLEVEKVDLILGTLSISEDINGLQILDVILDNYQLRNTYMVLFLDANEGDFVLPAFERGLLDSITAWGSTKEEMEKALKAMFERWEKLKYNELSISSHCIVHKLKEFPDRLVQYYRKILEFRQADARILMDLALLLRGKEGDTEAAVFAKKAILLEPSLQEEWGGTDSLASLEQVNVLGIHRVGILDPDSAVVDMLQKGFEELGASNIHAFTSASEALECFSSQIFDIILTEWNLSEMSGGAFLQRLTKGQSSISPILVMSTDLNEEDLVVLDELFVYGILKKPLTKEAWVAKVSWSLQEAKITKDPKLLVKNLRNLIDIGRIPDAAKELSHLRGLGAIDQGSILELSAQLSYAEKNFEQCKQFCLQALSEGEATIFILSLLAKALMKLREFDAAIRCLDVANTMAPGNIQRLCMLAEGHLETGEMKKASGAIESAAAIDPNSDEVKSARLKQEMLSGKPEKAKELMSGFHAPRNIISFMNSRAVSLSVSGKHEESIAIYAQTSAAISPERLDLHAIVFYNKALALARASDLSGCIAALTEAEKGADANLQPRVKSLKARALAAQEQSIPLKLNEVSKVVNLSQSEIENRMHQYTSNLKVQAGELSSYGILEAHSDISAISDKISKVAFKHRDSINRDEMVKQNAS